MLQVAQLLPRRTGLKTRSTSSKSYIFTKKDPKNYPVLPAPRIRRPNKAKLAYKSARNQEKSEPDSFAHSLPSVHRTWIQEDTIFAPPGMFKSNCCLNPTNSPFSDVILILLFSLNHQRVPSSHTEEWVLSKEVYRIYHILASKRTFQSSNRDFKFCSRPHHFKSQF